MLFLLASPALSQDRTSWDFVDHRDEDNKIDNLYPYKNGLVYVKTGKKCYKPSSVEYLDTDGNHQTLFSLPFFAASVQFFESDNGMLTIILSELIDIDVVFGGIVKIVFDGIHVDISGEAAVEDGYIGNRFLGFMSFANDTLWTVKEVDTHSFSDTTLQDVHIVEYVLDDYYSGIYLNKQNDLLVSDGSLLFQLSNLQSQTEEQRTVYTGELIMLNSVPESSFYFNEIIDFSIAASRDEVGVFTNGFKEHVYTLNHPEFVDDIQYYVDNNSLYARTNIYSELTTSIWQLDIVNQEWNQISDGSKFEWLLTDDVMQTQISAINDGRHIYIERLPLDSEESFSTISSLEITEAYVKSISPDKFETKVTVFNNNDFDICKINVGALLNPNHCQYLYFENDMNLLSNQEMEFIDTFYFSSQPTDLNYFIAGANFKRVDTQPVVADFIVSSFEIENEPLRLFPNPATDFITIINIDLSQKFNYSIIDIYGRTVSKDRLYESTVQLDDLATGVYYIQLRSKDEAYLGKVVKL